MNKNLEGIRVIDMATTGKGVAKVDGQVIFVEKAIPGDLVNLRITRKKKSFLESVVTEYIEYSTSRREPKCLHFGLCGGCKWQHVSYPDQLKFKENQVIQNLSRIGKVEIPEIKPILPSEDEYNYRNKLEFTFSNKRWLESEEIQSGEKIERSGLGFHMPGHFDKIVDIKECHLQGDLSNQIRNTLKDYALSQGLPFYDIRENKGLLRTVVVRRSSAGKVMIILQVAKAQTSEVEAVLSFLMETFPDISSAYYVVNTKLNDDFSDRELTHFGGEKWISETMQDPGGQADITFRISPKSFYQTNSRQAENLYHLAWDFAQLTGEEIVYDLYTGTGTIACYLARGAKKVIGIEYVEDAVRDARINAEINGFDHLHFFSGDMKDVITDEFILANGKPDVVITDPPRAGMHKEVCLQLLRLNSRKIIYISCNPSTQARDIELLSEQYKVTAVQPVDMFPHTPHVENIVVLEHIIENTH